MAESSWPTIAETAAQNSQPVDGEAGSDASEPSADAGGAGIEQTDAGDDRDDKP